MDAHDAFILVVNLKINPYNHGTLFSASGNAKEVLLDVWVKSGVNPAVGIRYLPINSSEVEIISFGPVRDFRLRRWNKVVMHVYRYCVCFNKGLRLKQCSHISPEIFLYHAEPSGRTV